MKDISAKQRRIFEYIRDFIDDHDYPPSIRQIQEACSISSTSVVDYNLRILERMGYIRRDREVSRAIEVTHGGARRGRIVPVPIIGTIAAGQPIPVPSADTWQADPSDSIEVSPDMLGNRENVYALRVKGTSMIDALVNDGDVVLLEATTNAKDGEMVAAWLKKEQEATLKKIFREGDRIRLQPANSTMDPIYTDAGNVEVQGKVIAAFRGM
ncbi:MAG TPA: transcriptional repressor LexA [Dehalococcoidia bacterium]|jgi:repressor LexA|nr:transcriptional repressor LexA [Dehalococcoidia bacterium]